ncbi:TPA: GNAT family N-acetyltransferase [Candidatus Poribacteria bacterium]|nr:GNAT family N-acetyltransferase [Candidatus Poribacteria bacterium]
MESEKMPIVSNWSKYYEEKRMSARDALLKIRSGSRVFLSPGCGEPQYLLDELVKLGGTERRLNDVEIVHMLTVGSAPHAQKAYDRNFRHNSLFVGPGVRSAVSEGIADYTPIFLSQIPSLFRSGRMPLDVAIIQVTPPDNYGFCSLGVSVEAVKAAVESADFVIAQVNRYMPRTLGNSFVHVEDIDAIVEHDEPLLEVPPVEPDDVALTIAKHINRLIENGSTLQVGIGTIPNAVLYGLQNKRDLGIHTELFSDSLIDLIESGVVNNSKKTFHPGKVLATFCIGTRRLYDYVDNNPMFEFHPVDYNSSPINIAKNEKMVAINTALQVDVTGQVCADSLGYRIYSGIGGQADFIRGAALAPNGKPIIALPSTAENGTISRIVPHLSEGAGVVTTRGDVHYVVTEYGVAYLHGKSLRERAIAMIQIAHPKFREQLLSATKAQKYIFEDQIIPEGAIYPVELEHTQVFGDMEIFIRPVKASDERLFQEYLYRLSERSIYLRFFQIRKAFPHDLAQELVAVDYQQNMGIVGTLDSSDTSPIVAAAHWMLDYNENMAEVAFSVADEYQRRGIGTYLLRLLIRLARERGIRGFRATVIASNTGMIRVFQKSGYVLHTDYDSGLVSLMFRFDEPSEAKQSVNKS